MPRIVFSFCSVAEVRGRVRNLLKRWENETAEIQMPNKNACWAVRAFRRGTCTEMKRSELHQRALLFLRKFLKFQREKYSTRISTSSEKGGPTLDKTRLFYFSENKHGNVAIVAQVAWGFGGSLWASDAAVEDSGSGASVNLRAYASW